MFLDSGQIGADSTIDAQICVVGAGPAGLTIASHFENSPFSVCIVESGGLALDPATQLLAEAEVTGVPFLPPHISRYRGFGGTSKRWAGFLRPLDDDDFAPRPWLAGSGWPIDRHELQPHYDAVLRLLALPVAEQDWRATAWTGELSVIAGLSMDGAFEPVRFLRAPERQFGAFFRQRMRHAPNMRVLLKGNAVDIETDAAAAHVERVRVQCLNGNGFWVRAKFFVLAAGGIENARLLLAANKVQPAGLGNGSDLVGRYLMNHPNFPAAWLKRTPAIKPTRFHWRRLAKTMDRMVLKTSAMNEEQIGKFSVQLIPVDAEGQRPWAKSDGFESFTALLGINTEVAHTESRALLLQKVAGDLPGLMADIGRRTMQYVRQPSCICVVSETEQVPNTQSRVTLSDTRDALGLNTAKINWLLDPLDKRTIRRGLQRLDQTFCEAGFGGLIYHRWLLDDDLDSFPGGDWGHHLGTTRMSDDPKRGVVDRNGRVHHMQNLYVVGGSVFPTSGMTPPTHTIMALALRLGHHLRDKL
jgi:choline dehydrogenase-like flavoprotein